MAAQWYLQSTKVPELAFRIVHLDRATMKATLQGDTGVPFDRDISEESLKKYGYKIVKRELAQENGDV